MIFHHIGIAVENIDMSIKVYSDMGYVLKNKVKYFDPIQNVNICFMFKKSHPLIELISPSSAKSPINRILKNNGSTPYHTCYEVDSIDKEIMNFKKIGFIQIMKPQNAIAFEGRKICFLISRSIGLIELLQK